MISFLIVYISVNLCSGQFFQPHYLNETKELMDLDIAIVKGMTNPYAKSQMRQAIEDTYEFYSKLEDVCDMIYAHDPNGFRIYDEFMHKDQTHLLKVAPHCMAVETFNETVLVNKYNWTEFNATELIMNYRGILYSWNKLENLRKTFVMTTSTTTTTEEPYYTYEQFDNITDTFHGNNTRVTRLPRRRSRGTYKRRAKSDVSKEFYEGRNSTLTPRTGKTRGTYKKATHKIESGVDEVIF